VRRVAVIGSGGSGKSTLAGVLGERLGLPVVHLDPLFWKPGWVARSQAEWRALQEELVRADEWIIDGNHEPTLEVRLRAADTVVMLDYGRLRCLWRVLKRWHRYRGRPREDRADGCDERLDRAFLGFVWSYPRHGRAAALDAVARHAPGAAFVRLGNPAQTRRFLASLDGAVDAGRGRE
jgi:adenylate kinase family enzyme